MRFLCLSRVGPGSPRCLFVPVCVPAPPVSFYRFSVHVPVQYLLNTPVLYWSIHWSLLPSIPNANPCPMKRARMASECDHRLMNDDKWDDFWYNLDARYQDLEHQPVPAPTKPQMTFSQEFHLAAEAKAREDAAALSRSRTNPKSHRCGACTACRASDCGRCKNCRDKPRCAFCASPQAAPRLRPAWHAGAPSPLAGCLRRRYAPSAEMRPLSLPRPVSPPAVSPPTNASFAVL